MHPSNGMLFSSYKAGRDKENILTADLGNLAAKSVVKCGVFCAVLASCRAYYFHQGGVSGGDCRLSSNCNNATESGPQRGVFWHQKVTYHFF
jgi:hypothetical protein